MNPRVLFVVNGLGMGNSTRCYAIIEHLHRAGVEIHVLTSGNGLFFFKDKPEVASLNAMDAFQYGRKGGNISVFRTLTAIGRLCRLYKRKTRRLEEVLDHVRPDLVVIDSEYCILPVRRRRIPLLAINNSDVVVSEYLRRKDNPRAIRWQFWLVEFMDYLFHRTFCNMVLSPALLPCPPRHHRFRRIGVIVREDLLEAIRNARETAKPDDHRPPWLCSCSADLRSVPGLTFHNATSRAELRSSAGRENQPATCASSARSRTTLPI